MFKLRTAILPGAVLLLGLLYQPGQAHATRTINLPSTGWTVIGYLSSVTNPGNWAATLPAGGGACQWTWLGYSSNHGLDQWTVVLPPAGNGGDIVQVLASPASNNICGFTTWNAPLMNGFGMDINGLGGADTLLQGNNSQSFAYGNEGQDWVWGNITSALSMGGPDNDMVFGWDHGGDMLFGEQGNDVLCEHRNSVATKMDCGPGTNDGTCGTAQTRVNCESGINVMCSSCGSGY
jgi:hypothetical protein